MIAAHAIEMGIDKTLAAFLLSIGGIISVVGKLVVGYVCDHPKVVITVLNNSEDYIRH